MDGRSIEKRTASLAGTFSLCHPATPKVTFWEEVWSKQKNEIHASWFSDYK